MWTRTGGRVAWIVEAFSPVKEEKVEAEKWEVSLDRMLVQIRNAYGDTIMSSTTGKMKKELSARTGLHPLDMKLMYKEKERASAAFLDAIDVKDRSKILLMEDPMVKAKRLLEMRKTDKIDKAAKSFFAIHLKVNHLTSKVHNM
ncbi:hypothetical protein ZIOFF_069937 [Zingiber officinale]|uniref:Ubiquitin-like domain-containing protein n=1 Tax=Zingiber officinale TaxID=94328 RepID=A0A8J5C6P9_ZINOF|nr:hypothetical protein ZIOFF_069937 [Zingiber officinale]